MFLVAEIVPQGIESIAFTETKSPFVSGTLHLMVSNEKVMRAY